MYILMMTLLMCLQVIPPFAISSHGEEPIMIHLQEFLTRLDILRTERRIYDEDCVVVIVRSDQLRYNHLL